MNKHMVTVDPGFNTAIADWGKSESIVESIPPIVEFFIVPVSLNGEKKLQFAWDKFYDIIVEISPDICYIEGTMLWQENLTSLTSGSKGDLLTLTRLIGGYCHICHRIGLEYELLTVERWKGQMSKEAVKQRIIREKGWMFKNDHITDAVGMGLSLINNWRETK